MWIDWGADEGVSRGWEELGLRFGMKVVALESCDVVIASVTLLERLRQ